MIEKGKTYIVMGLLDNDSAAYAIGKGIEEQGGKVVYTMQSERMKRLIFNRNKTMSQEEKDSLHTEFCDVTVDEEVKALFDKFDNVAGVVHSIAFANPKTCLGEEYHTDAYDDLKTGFHISVISLATVARYAAPKMPDGGSIVCLSFASQLAFAYYNWMGVNKAALEANVRALCRRHGKDLIRVNAISAGPMSTKAAGAITGFDTLADTWNKCSPIPWDKETDKVEVANAVLFMLGPYSKKISGQVLYVDGGASVVGGELQPHERPGA